MAINDRKNRKIVVKVLNLTIMSIILDEKKYRVNFGCLTFKQGIKLNGSLLIATV